MNKITTGLLATTLAASFAAASMVPANAAPVYMPQVQSANSDVTNVEYRKFRHFRGGHHFRGGNNFGRSVSSGGFWNGHRGYREYHRGYRRHGDFWFPLAAFATGALITGAIANQDRYSGGSHEDYCYSRYKSYRASDNTFQPYNGPRQQCR